MNQKAREIDIHIFSVHDVGWWCDEGEQMKPYGQLARPIPSLFSRRLTFRLSPTFSRSILLDKLRILTRKMIKLAMFSLMLVLSAEAFLIDQHGKTTFLKLQMN